jgi:prepilin-type N-terminal cleavage/methylation domain-containing protein
MPNRIQSTTNDRHRLGFTLIEVLTVVIVMTVLAGAILPRYVGSADEVKESLMKHNMHLIEVQLEFYRSQHFNRYPTIQNNALPQMTNATNIAGEIGKHSANYPLGPYILEPPTNPFDGSRNVTPVAVQGQRPKSIGGRHSMRLAIRRVERLSLAESRWVLQVENIFTNVGQTFLSVSL